MAFKKPSWETKTESNIGAFKKPSWETASATSPTQPTVSAKEEVPQKTNSALDRFRSIFKKETWQKTELTPEEEARFSKSAIDPKSKTGQFASGLAKGATFIDDKNRNEGFNLPYLAGEIVGASAPFGVAYKGAGLAVKGASKALPILTKSIPRIAATGALAGAPVGAVQGAVEGKDAKGVAKNALLYGAMGAAGDVAIEGILIPALKPIVGKILERYKGKPIIADVMEKEVAKDIGVNWENMNDTQRNAIRKVVLNMQGEATQSGRLLPKAQEFTMRDLTVADKAKSLGLQQKPLLLNSAKNDILPIKEVGSVSKEITIPFRKNTEKAPKMLNDDFAQSIEPKGDYINFHDPEWGTKLPNHEYGNITFKNPLVVEYGTTSHGGWKTKLSEKYGGKTGTALSNAVKKDGYDGIITINSQGKEVVEIVNFGGRKSNIGNPVKAQTENDIIPPALQGGVEKKITTNQGEANPLLFKTQIPRPIIDKTPIPPMGFKQTIEVPRIYDKNAFTGQSKTRRQIAEELGVLPRNPLAPLDANGQRIIKGIDEVKKPLSPPEMPQAVMPKADDIDTKQMLAPVKSKGLKRAKEIIASLPTLPTKAYTALVDNLNPIAKATKAAGPQSISEDAYKLGMLTRNAEGTVDYIKNSALVDRSGQVIGEGWQSIAKDIPEKFADDFNDYLLHKHNIARYGQKKPLFGNKVTSEISASKVKAYEYQHPEFIELSKRINTLIDKAQRAWGIDSGLVEQSLYDNVLKGMYPDYIPGFRQTIEGVKGNMLNKLGPAKIIKSAVGGDEKIIPPTESIPMLLEKLVKNARKNEAYQALLKQVRKNPDKMRGVAEVVDPDAELMASVINKRADYGIESVLEKFEGGMIEDARKGRFLIVMEGGLPKTLKINDPDYWKALKEIASPRQAGAIEKTGRKLTQPFKNVVTGYNPIFATRNIARDIPTAVINSIENNPAVFGKNAKEALQEMMSNSKNFQEFTALGGARGNFFANTTGPTKYNPLQKVGDFNNLTETLPRFTEYLNTIKKGGGSYESKLEGIYNAAEVTVNFSRRGDVTKAIDAWVPYFNPAMQGFDKFRRQLINRPLATAAKGLATVTAPTTAIYMLNQAVNKEAYDQLDNRTKDNYYVIPTGEGKFIKIAKSRETGVLFGSLFERLYRLAQGEEESFKGFPNTVKTNFAPQNPFEDNIYSPINDLRRNKDFANRTIVPQSLQRLSPRYQYDERTSEIGKAIGDKFNLSPKQVDFIIKSYTGVIGTLALPATTKTASLKDTLSRQFIADPLYSNEIMDKFYERKEEIDTGFADQKVTGMKPPFPPAERTLLNKTADKFADTRKKINKILADPNKTDEQKKAETERLQGIMIEDAKKVLSRYKK